MSKITGTIEEITMKEFASGKNYRIKMDGEWYGGFPNGNKDVDLGTLVAGDVVTFTETVKGKYKNFTDLTIGEKASPAKQKKAEQKANVKDAEYKFAVTLGGVMKTAVDMVSMLLANEAVPLPTKKGDKNAFIVNLVKETAVDLTYWSLQETEEYLVALEQENDEEKEEEAEVTSDERE